VEQTFALKGGSGSSFGRHGTVSGVLRSQARAVTPRSPQLAVVLSAIWPGLGQSYLGDARTAAVLAIPPALILLPIVAAALRGPEGWLVFLVVPLNALLLVAAAAMSIGFRLTSMWLVGRRVGGAVLRRHRRLIWGVTGFLLVAHVLAIYAAFGLFDVTSRVFGGAFSDRPDASGPQASSDVVVGVLPSAEPLGSADQRFSILLVGSDFGTGYTHSLTDTMMVVSVDPVSKTVVMASVPRDTARFPMWDGTTYNGKLNSLMTAASNDHSRYPEGGIGTLAHEISYLVGVPIQYIAYINLGGFGKLIDAVGGVDVVVARAIDDANYQFPDGKQGFHLSAGPHHLDARTAMAYVRSRYGAGDNDFTRARRQQELLLALKDKLLSPAVLPKVPTILDAISRLVTTNYPADGVSRLLDLSHQIQPDSIQRFVLGPPYAINPPGGGEYVLVPDMDRYAKWSIKTFGSASRYASN
jgi:LCP family protein required for cell wall assembly